MAPRLFVHIVTYCSARFIVRCLEALINQVDVDPRSITIEVTDNGSTDQTVEEVSHFLDRVSLHPNQQNLGFCGAHNQGVSRFLSSGADYLLILNPDVALHSRAVREFIDAVELDPTVHYACGKLLRSSDTLEPLVPPRFDSTGIIFTTCLRHFDRAAEHEDLGQYDEREVVAGASGACVFVSREFVHDLSFRTAYDDDLSRLYPQLADGRTERVQLFDEAFFAYREDADLAWRAATFGWSCIYLPTVVGYHHRCVTPERRRSLPAELNRWGVRNRFLLQINNLHLYRDWRAVLPGLIMRNVVVVAATLFSERTSLPAFRDLAVLLRRAWYRRRHIMSIANERRESLQRAEENNARPDCVYYGSLFRDRRSHRSGNSPSRGQRRADRPSSGAVAETRG